MHDQLWVIKVCLLKYSFLNAPRELFANLFSLSSMSMFINNLTNICRTLFLPSYNLCHECFFYRDFYFLYIEKDFYGKRFFLFSFRSLQPHKILNVFIWVTYHSVLMCDVVEKVMTVKLILKKGARKVKIENQWHFL